MLHRKPPERMVNDEEDSLKGYLRAPETQCDPQNAVGASPVTAMRSRMPPPAQRMQAGIRRKPSPPLPGDNEKPPERVQQNGLHAPNTN